MALYDGTEPVRRPRLSQWSPTVAEIVGLRDDVRELTMHFMRANFTGSPPFEPRPRPETLIDRMLFAAAEGRRLARHQALVDRLLPNRNTDDL